MLCSGGGLRRIQLLAKLEQHAGITGEKPIIRSRTVELPAGEIGRHQSPLDEVRCGNLQAEAMAVRGCQSLDAGLQNREQRLSGPRLGLAAKLPAGLRRMPDVEAQIDVAVIVRLNMLLRSDAFERRAQHFSDQDRSIREQIMPTKQCRITLQEVDIHAGNQLSESVCPDIGAYRGIGGKF